MNSIQGKRLRLCASFTLISAPLATQSSGADEKLRQHQRVLAAPQDLKSGELTLTVISGRIRATRAAAVINERFSIITTCPMVPSDPLNLCYIEQALENLKRALSSDADIQIAPGADADAQPVDSDMVVTRKQARTSRRPMGADDGGSKTTGSNYAYHEHVAGVSQRYVYRGRSNNLNFQLPHLIHRDAVSKTTVGTRLWQCTSQNFIEDAEQNSQERHLACGEINLGHKHFIGVSTVDANMAYRWGKSTLGSQPAPEEASGEGTKEPRLWTTKAQLNHPLQRFCQPLRYTDVWRVECNPPLVSQDHFALAGCYTVRGLDEERMLPGDRCWLIRDDRGMPLGSNDQEAYLSLHHGRVGLSSAKRLVGKELTGTVLKLLEQVKGV